MHQKRRNMAILFVTLVIIMLGFGIIIPLIPFYVDGFGARGSELGLLMATLQVGTLLTVIGLISAIMQGALTGPLTKRWGETPIPDRLGGDARRLFA